MSARRPSAHAAERPRRPASPRSPAAPRTPPPIRYPEQLPISQRKDDIANAVREHQVVIVAGETGSGKTTQLPKICLELGRGGDSLIGHTQPRRLAARTVAERIAEELDTPLGDVVGYQVRFTDRVGDRSMIKVMTDGILLTEIQRDPDLRRYDTLIVDEAHERSLNIDFILGHLRRLLPRRPDLKLIVTSATIDPERFSRHFDDAPVIEVSGRTYPVEVRYRPVVEDADDAGRDQIQAVCDAVAELRQEQPGDILVFASGEREIRDTADALQAMRLADTEILPLYARLSGREQHRVFERHPGRRIVVATNVAETSLTVPGIRYVVDPGTARISRYSNRTKVQRLPIEPVSQASADQRKGRCGRLSDGICIRLYSEADFASRPRYTDPEILRTSLASVILQMTAARLGDIETFPFLDPPDRRHVRDGVRTLEELGALEPGTTDGRPRLTDLGRRLARLPVDPRLGRMVLESERNSCVDDVLVVVSALSIQDPRERPADRKQAADEKHARFADKDSDFLAYLNLWNYVTEQQRVLSSSQFRRLCRTEYLHYLRIREWQDLYGQLRQVVRQLGMPLRQPEPPPGPGPDEATGQAGRTGEAGRTGSDAARIHTSLLAGLLTHIGVRDAVKREYLGARNARFAIFPGSALAKKQPQWVMAAELVETSRLWGRVVARIEPSWIEPVAGHLVKRSHSEPHWEKKQGAVMAYEKVTLYGVPVVARRKVHYHRIDPAVARELFIRHALVEGDWETRHEFFHGNQERLTEVEELEHRVRRRDLVVDDEALFAFYDARIPSDVVSARHFDTWWRKARQEQPRLLDVDPSLLTGAVGETAESDYPDVWSQDELRLRLTYQFEPGTEADGVTLHVPLPLLDRLDPEPLAWLVPGLRAELVTALIRSLPKALRRNFVPVPDHVQDVLADLEPDATRKSLLAALERGLRQLTGVTVPRSAWQLDRLPLHLRMNVRVVDEHGRALAEGRDLTALTEQLRPQVRRTVASAGQSLERRGLVDWSVGTLPRTVEQELAGHRVTAYPALVDEGDSVAVRVFGTAEQQRQAMWRGTRRLLLLTLPAPVTFTQGRLTNRQKLALARNPHGGVGALLDDCAGCALDELLADAGGPAWDEPAFRHLRDAVRPQLGDTLVEVLGAVEGVLTAAAAVPDLLVRTPDEAGPAATADIRRQLAGLVYPGFVTDTGYHQLPELERYLEAIRVRLGKLPQNPARDRQLMLDVEDAEGAYAELVDVLGAERPEVRDVRWLLEELRVSLFAQHLGTARPVSVKRIHRAVDDLLDSV